jgi:hypothetical protein
MKSDVVQDGRIELDENPGPQGHALNCGQENSHSVKFYPYHDSFLWAIAFSIPLSMLIFDKFLRQIQYYSVQLSLWDVLTHDGKNKLDQAAINRRRRQSDFVGI